MRLTLFLLITVVLLFGIYSLLAPQATPPDSSPATHSTAAEQPAVQAQASPRRFEIGVGENGRNSGPEVIRVSQGEDVELLIHAEIEDQLHLHGYDLQADLQPGQTTRLRFVAELSGRFDYEIHRRHLTIGFIEVMPAM